MAHYPPVGFYFSVVFLIDNAQCPETAFQEVSGLSAELGVEEYAEGGENRFSHRLPARGKYPNLLLKRGLLSGSTLAGWFKKAAESMEFKPANVTVTLLNENGQPLLAWRFDRVWPIKWSTSDFKAQENSIAVETLELAYSSFTKITV